MKTNTDLNQDGWKPEPVEERGPTKGNARQEAANRAQSRGSASIGLERVRQAARRDGSERFTSLLHHVDVDLLRDAYYAMKRQAAVGVDGVTWQQYGEGLEDRLADLHTRVHRGTYRAQPSRRTYIPKGDGRQRPLGIASLEDKVVQQAVRWVLEAIYEQDFLGFSYGFRPGRSQHDALDALTVGLERRKVNWVLDADIQGFFDEMDHDWMLTFLEHRIGDRRVLRLIRKWLRAGVSEDGEWSRTTKGTPQGAVISPLLANVYLHYALDQWVDQWRRQGATGDVVVVRYADDFVVGFQHRSEAERFRSTLAPRLERFGLTLHPEKTRMIEFGRYAAERRSRRGEGKPETFDFLGFTHRCGKNGKTGYFVVERETVKKRLRAKLKEIRERLRKAMHVPVTEVGRWLRSVVQGYYNYHAVPGNLRRLRAFHTEVERTWLWVLRRRGQKHRLSWNRYRTLCRRWIPRPQILHPFPRVRFDAKYPR